jgi:hypothetical protein
VLTIAAMPPVCVSFTLASISRTASAPFSPIRAASWLNTTPRTASGPWMYPATVMTMKISGAMENSE